MNESDAPGYKASYFAGNYNPIFMLEGFQEDANEVANQLAEIFHLDDYRVFIKTLDGPEGKDSVEYKFSSVYDEHEPVELIDVIVNASGGEQTTVNDFMASRGYTLIRTMKSKVIADNFDIYGIHLVYAPTNPRPVTGDVMKCGTIYHVTSLDRLRRIRTEGLVPQDSRGDAGIFYSGRLYFFLDRTDAGVWKKDLQQKYPDRRYFIVAVDTADIPEEAVFYYDSLMRYKKAVFTNTAVPPSVLYVVD